jgi:phosphatidylglycerophosphatase A
MNAVDEKPAERHTKASGLAVLLATGLGAGFSPVAPGTVGALWGVLLAWGLERLVDRVSLTMPSAAVCQAVAIVALCAAGVPVCTAAARRLGGKKDPGSIVLDEIASMPIAFYLIPIANWKIAAAGFVLHRLFDVTKPPPARQLERLPGGLGIMADDWAAALYANLALRAVLYLAWF